ncbi:hypothetical protein C8F04DRAFT_1395413 [Mycena alexandri]|uniref:SSCRP protein n=1 Tax=Mycena alexandri TaxID=1745969 RepID=A0AAD6SZJ6_9AGAR|nr:hypothetical protein C8F04DRAFT_1395413 [Mycena alexandri]
MRLAIAISTAMSLVALVSGAAIDGEAQTTPLAAPFGINIGFNPSQGNTVAWVAGQSKCTAVPLGPIGANFCGRDFVLINPFTGNGITFVAGGCGESPFWITQVSKGGIFAECTSFGEADACDVTTEWHCI